MQSWINTHQPNTAVPNKAFLITMKCGKDMGNRGGEGADCFKLDGN